MVSMEYPSSRDALYVELAEQLRAPLITTDRRLASKYAQVQVL
jgi:predicted nucleic acid-binding protein